MRLLICLVVLVFAGCSSDPHSVMRTPTAVKSSLHSLQGKTLDYVTQKLGLPDEVSSIGKNQLFVFKKEDGDWHCSVKLLSLIHI